MASLLPRFLRRSSRVSAGFASSIRLRSVPSDRLSSPFTHRYYYTSPGGFTSVHGVGSSSEYAKRRKESLETEFGHILGARYRALFVYARFGPFLALYRASIVSFEVAKLTFWHFVLKDIHKRAEKFRETLTRLGPFYIKLGQALSTRSDILPSAYCKELSKLQDQIPPFSTRVAMKSIESQLGSPVSDVFADISPQPIAAASLGQVYKAHLHSGELVAVKVQRPGMMPFLTLDALLFQLIGGQLKRFAKARKDLLVAVNEMVRHMFNEIDYILEAQNCERFSSLYSSGKSLSSAYIAITLEEHIVRYQIPHNICKSGRQQSARHSTVSKSRIQSRSDAHRTYFGSMGVLTIRSALGFVRTN